MGTTSAAVTVSMPAASPSAARRSIARGFAGLTAGRAAASLLSAAWLVVVARHLPLASFGDLALLLALGAIFNTVSDPGVQLVLADHVARAGRIHAQTLRRVLLRRQLTGLACAVLCGALYMLAARDRSVEVPLMFAISVLATTVYSSALTAYRALGPVALDAANEIASRLLVLGVGSFLLARGGGLRAVVATYALADVASAVVVLVVVRVRHVDRGPDLSPADLRWRSTRPLAFASVAAVLYYRVDLYLLGLVQGSAAAGLYGAAYRLLDGALIPAGATGNIALAHTSPRSAAERHHVVRRLVGVALLTTIPIVVLGAAVATPVMRGLFGPEFAAAGPVAIVLLLSAIPGAVVGSVGNVAATADRAAFSRVFVVALIANVGANLVLVPRFGALGAAWATLGSQCLLAAALYGIVRSPAAPVAFPSVRHPALRS